MTTRTIKASELCEGQAVTAVSYTTRTLLRRRPVIHTEPVSKFRGQWPIVRDVLVQTVGGQTTVFMTLNNNNCSPLDPDDEITIQEQ